MTIRFADVTRHVLIVNCQLSILNCYVACRIRKPDGNRPLKM